MIRVGGGKFRGREILVPSYLEVPTKEVVRMAMMNAVQFLLPGASVLDVFAGSGALGIEALSRGASKAVFLEKEPEGARTIEENLRRLDIKGGNVIQGDALESLRSLEGSYRIAFVDPPYREKRLYEESCRLLLSGGLLEEGGRILLEYEGEFPVPGLIPLREKRHGRTSFAIIGKI